MKTQFRIPFIIALIICSLICLNSCEKKPTPPVVTTAGVSGITQTASSSGGNVTGDGGAEVTARGVCWNTSENPTTTNSKTSDGTGTGTFTSSLTQLTPGTKYYVKAYATNEAGTGYGSQLSFTTWEVLLATLTTSDVTSITKISAVSGGNITSDGGGTVTARGVCWSTRENPTTADSKTSDGSGIGSFTSNITGLSAGNTYYVRAYAINNAGTSYASQRSFNTPEDIGAIIFNPSLTYGTVADIEGNTYKTIQIGTQIWMAENLKTTKYNDGTAIPNVTGGTEWGSLTSDGYCWYNNDPSTYKAVYGALYNSYAVNKGNLCPTGWHVPINDEWATLLNFPNVHGEKLKETGTIHWSVYGGTNESGFTALPGGVRELPSAGYYEGYHILGSNGYYWTSSPYYSPPGQQGWVIIDNFTHSVAWANYYKYLGCSVRCLKD